MIIGFDELCKITNDTMISESQGPHLDWGRDGWRLVCRSGKLLEPSQAEGLGAGLLRGETNEL